MRLKNFRFRSFYVFLLAFFGAHPVTTSGLQASCRSPFDAVEKHCPAAGVNMFDLAKKYLGTSDDVQGAARYQGVAYETVSRAMAQKAIKDARYRGVDFIRVSATGIGPYTFDTPGDLDLWLQDRTVYWQIIRNMLDDMAREQVRIVPVFVWNSLQFPAYAHETVDQLITNPNSQSYRMLQAYIREFISQFRYHPALAGSFYELTNELDLHADLDEVGRCADYLRTHPGEFPDYQCQAKGNFSTDQMIAFMGRLAEHVRSLDPKKPISSGFASSKISAQHLRHRPEWSREGPDWTRDSEAEFKKYLLETHDAVNVISMHLYNFDSANERFGVQGHTNADFLDIVAGIAKSAGKQLFVGEFGDWAPSVSEDSNAHFSQNVLKKIADLRISGAIWAWEFYRPLPYIPDESNIEPGFTDVLIKQFRSTNMRLGHQVYQRVASDATPPEVVLTWPLADAICKGREQLVYAVASDDQSDPVRVEFFADMVRLEEIQKPPYQLVLNTMQFFPGALTLTAIAYDGAGNQTRYITKIFLENFLPPPEIPNAGFEALAEDRGESTFPKPQNWILFPWCGQCSVAESEQFTEGRDWQAMRFTDGNDRMAEGGAALRMSNGMGRADSYVLAMSKAVPVRPGQPYELEWQMRLAGELYMGVYAYDAAGREVGRTDWTITDIWSSAWKNFALSFTASRETASIRLVFALHAVPEPAGVDIDAIRLQ